MNEIGAKKELVRERFTAASQRYVSDRILAAGEELERMVALARLSGGERVLDLATGGGHTALAFAPLADHVVVSDLTSAMLAAARAHLVRTGVRNASYEIADAEALPFAGLAFDVVTARFAPHHFPLPQRFLAESFRVLRPGGRLVVFDNMAPEDPALDEFLHTLESWRDPGHFRAHRLSVWLAWCEEAGFTVEAVDPLSFKTYEFAEWTARMAMPETEREALQLWLLGAPATARQYFALETRDGRVVRLKATFGAFAARKPEEPFVPFHR